MCVHTDCSCGRYRWLPDSLISASCIPSTSLYNALSFILCCQIVVGASPCRCLFLLSLCFLLFSLEFVRSRWSPVSCSVVDSARWHHSSRRGIQHAGHHSPAVCNIGIWVLLSNKESFYLHLASAYTARDNDTTSTMLYRWGCMLGIMYSSLFSPHFSFPIT